MSLRNKPVAIALVAIAIVGSIVGWRATQAQKPEEKKDGPVTLEFTPADIAVVEVRSLTRSIPFSGSLAPVVWTAVKSKVPGEVTRVFVREGEAVTAGQLLAQIDTADLQSRVDAQAAALEEAKARLNIAEKNRANNQQLLHQKFISQNAYDTTESTFDATAASMRSQEAQLRIARKALDDAAVRAPIAGAVATRSVHPGEKVGIDSALFTIVDLGRMEIEAPAPASEVPSVKVGQSASFGVDGFADRKFEGRVERINPTAQPGSRAIVLYISVANRDGVLRGGMFAKGRIVLDNPQPATVVPATAIREESGQAYVFTLENGKIARRPVKVGSVQQAEGVVEVLSGLERGMSVVAARVSGLKAGAPARLKTADTTPAKAG
jgi:membrane fusion protein (multidrug efflux system)